MKRYGIVASMKDFYWDIRPKPEYGTIEIRVCDTPLTIRRAALVAAYAQALAGYYLEERPLEPAAAVYQVNAYNRFEACRYGYAGTLVDPFARRRKAIGEDILDSIAHAMPQALRLGCAQGLSDLAAEVRGGYSDAGWLRAQRGAGGSLGDVVRKAAERWASG
jgi:carboxylate-amine ligase